MRHFLFMVAIITFFASLLAIPFTQGEDFAPLGGLAILIGVVTPLSFVASIIVLRALINRKEFGEKKRNLLKILLVLFAYNGTSIWIGSQIFSMENQLLFINPLIMMIFAVVAFIVIVSNWQTLE
jgi:hypothetical protein